MWHHYSISRARATITRSWLLTIHKVRNLWQKLLKNFFGFQKWGKKYTNRGLQWRTHGKVCIRQLVHILKKLTFWQVPCCTHWTRHSKVWQRFLKFCGLLRKPKSYIKNKEKHWERRISYCFLISLRIEEIDDSRGLDSGKINTDENLISVVETSMADDQ